MSMHLRGLAGLVFLGLLAISLLPELAAQDAGKKQPPGDKKDAGRDEKEDPNFDKIKSKVKRIDVDEPKGTEPKQPAPSAPSPVADLAQAAHEAKHPRVRELFRDLAVPHDKLTFKTNSKVELVQPLPRYLGADGSVQGTLTLHRLDSDYKPITPEWKNISPNSIAMHEPYEDLAVHKVTEFEKLNLERSFANGVTLYEQSVIKEQVLGAVLRFHDSARERDLRKGPAWDLVEKRLRGKLRDVMLEQLHELTAAANWDAAFALSRRLAEASTSADDLKRVAGPLAELVRKALRTGEYDFKDENVRVAAKRLRELYLQYPNSEAVGEVVKSLKDKAQALFDSAKKKAEDPKRASEAIEELRTAADCWPDLPGLRDFRLQLDKKHQILRVGVRGLPQYLSPALATTDVEKRCVEMLFESLVKASVDEDGVTTYQAGLAEGRAKVVSLGREFRLPRDGYWSNSQPITAGDVRASVALVKKGIGRPRAWGELLDRVVPGGDPYRVEVAMTRGFIDPLALMTFKIVPQGLQAGPESEEFAREPIGSGPYRYAGQKSEAGKPYLLFLANPNFSSRASKLAQGAIREIRFFTYADVKEELARPQPLDLFLDLTGAEAEQVAKHGAYQITRPGKGSPNRRVYFLAVNPEVPALAVKEVRRAISLAIDREKLLDAHFRHNGTRAHKALATPFPAHTWPTPETSKDKPTLDPHDLTLAKGLMEPVLSKGKFGQPIRLTLKYADETDGLKKAMEDLRDQLRPIGIELMLEPRDPYALRKEVEVPETRSFQLAYYWYDFPDDTYWLAPLLGSRGLLPCRSEAVEDLFRNATSRRNFTDLKKVNEALYKVLIDDVPVIPLWQLDVFHAIHKDVKPVPFDPHLVFTDIERWQRK